MKEVNVLRNKIRSLFNTPHGKDVLKYYVDTYVTASCIEGTTELTYYRLGIKEFIQGLQVEALREEDLPETDDDTTEDYLSEGYDE